MEPKTFLFNDFLLNLMENILSFGLRFFYGYIKEEEMFYIGLKVTSRFIEMQPMAPIKSN